MTSDDWEGAISLLVSNLHRPDQELLVLLQSCVAGQQIASMFFFSRVRTPCGHGAQVIVEGREKQSDGGENNKDHNHNPQTTTKGPQAESPPSCSLSSVLGETGETKKSVWKGA